MLEKNNHLLAYEEFFRLYFPLLDEAQDEDKLILVEKYFRLFFEHE
jgi:hypothetical protein